MTAHARTVLVVDDEPDILELLQILLGGAGYRVVTAGGGRQAMQTLDQLCPDLVLLDIMMPDVDGHAVCAHIRGQDRLRAVPVYFLTAKNDVSHIGRALDHGANGFIVKPFDTEDLLNLLEACFSGGQTIFYSPGKAVMVTPPRRTPASSDSRVAVLSLTEPHAAFSVVVGAAETPYHHLLSLWQREDGDLCVTTAVLNLESSEHFGDLLNRVLAAPGGVHILHCSIYRRLEDVPMHKLEHA
jgi:CheY-like chemotaxis protein